MFTINGINSESISLFRDLLRSSSRVTVVSHVNPDGDAAGSSLGLYHYLRSKGKCAKIVFPSRLPDSLGFMVGQEASADILYWCEEIKAEILQTLSQTNLLICVDFNSLSRIEQLGETVQQICPAKRVLIDHHAAPDLGAFDLAFSNTEISSASEYVFYVLREMEDGDPLAIDTLTALFTGMTTDTNNFANSTYPSTLQMAIQCLEAGVDRDSILEHIFNCYSENRLRLQGYLLSEKLLIFPSGLAFMQFTQADKKRFPLRDGETEGFVNLPLAIGKVKMSIFLKQEVDCWRISIRSKGDIKANLCCKRYFCGGGHDRAAGGRLPLSLSPKAAEEYVIECAEKFLSE